MKKCVIKVLKDTAILVRGHPKSLLRVCAYLDPKRMFDPKFIRGDWDGYLRLSVGNKFPRGLLSAMVGFHQKRNYKVRIIDRSGFKPGNPKDISKSCLYGVTLRPDQVGLVRSLMPVSVGCVSSPTGSGKTLILAALIRYLRLVKGYRVCVITSGVGLVRQNAAEFQKLLGDEIKVGVVGDKSKNVQEVTSVCGNSLLATRARYVYKKVGNRRKLVRRPANPKIKKLLQFEAILGDELQCASGDTWYDFLRGSKAVVRYGVSATIRDQRNLLRNLKLDATFGPMQGIVHHKDLVRDKLSKRVDITMRVFGVENRYHMLTGKDGYQEAYQRIYTSKDHIERVTHDVQRLVKQGRVVAVLTRTMAVYCALAERMSEMNIYKMSGSTPTFERTRIKKMLMDEVSQVLLANRVFTVGENCPIIDAVIFAEGVGAHIPAVQGIGRGTRKMEGRPDNAIVIDYAPRQHERIFQHAIFRVESYESQGYGVNIVDAA